MSKKTLNFKDTTYRVSPYQHKRLQSIFLTLMLELSTLAVRANPVSDWLGLGE